MWAGLWNAVFLVAANAVQKSFEEIERKYRRQLYLLVVLVICWLCVTIFDFSSHVYNTAALHLQAGEGVAVTGVVGLITIGILMFSQIIDATLAVVWLFLSLTLWFGRFFLVLQPMLWLSSVMHGPELSPSGMLFLSSNCFILFAIQLQFFRTQIERVLRDQTPIFLSILELILRLTAMIAEPMFYTMNPGLGLFLSTTAVYKKLFFLAIVVTLVNMRENWQGWIVALSLAANDVNYNWLDSARVTAFFASVLAAVTNHGITVMKVGVLPSRTHCHAVIAVRAVIGLIFVGSLLISNSIDADASLNLNRESPQSGFELQVAATGIKHGLIKVLFAIAFAVLVMLETRDSFKLVPLDDADAVSTSTESLFLRLRFVVGTSHPINSHTIQALIDGERRIRNMAQGMFDFALNVAQGRIELRPQPAPSPWHRPRPFDEPSPNGNNLPLEEDEPLEIGSQIQLDDPRLLLRDTYKVGIIGQSQKGKTSLLVSLIFAFSGNTVDVRGRRNATIGNGIMPESTAVTAFVARLQPLLVIIDFVGNGFYRDPREHNDAAVVEQQANAEITRTITRLHACCVVFDVIDQSLLRMIRDLVNARTTTGQLCDHSCLYFIRTKADVLHIPERPEVEQDTLAQVTTCLNSSWPVDNRLPIKLAFLDLKAVKHQGPAQVQEQITPIYDWIHPLVTPGNIPPDPGTRSGTAFIPPVVIASLGAVATTAGIGTAFATLTNAAAISSTMGSFAATCIGGKTLFVGATILLGPFTLAVAGGSLGGWGLYKLLK